MIWPPDISKLNVQYGFFSQPSLTVYKFLDPIFKTPYPKKNEGIKSKNQPIPFPTVLVPSIILRMKITRGPIAPKIK